MYSRIEYCSNCKIGHKIRSLLSKYLQNSYKLEKACHIATSGRPGQVTKFLVFLDRNHHNWSAYVDSGKTEMITAKLPLSSSRIPIGAGLKVICTLSYFADKINVYGWDFYLDSSPEYMSTWEAFLNLYKIKLDIYRSKTHFECAIINYYYGYHLSKLPNINNYGYLGKLDMHERLIRKIERVLFN